MKYNIIPMEKHHIPALVELEKQSFSLPWSAQQLEDCLYMDNVSFLVAVSEDDMILGYGGLSVVLDEGNLNNIAIFPKYQKQGVAGQILDIYCRFAQENLAFLTLEVRPSNLPALALYKKYGFVQEAVRKDYYDQPKEDALILTRRFREGHS